MKDRITIAIPVYNETDAVIPLIKKVISLNLNIEIIMVDDGSTFPKTKKILQTIKHDYPDVRVIHNTTNQGKSRSVLTALEQARGNIFVILDADGELDPEGILDLYSVIKKTKCDLVNGTRVVAARKSLKTHTNYLTRIAKKIIRWGFILFYGASVDDVLSGYKMFRTNIFNSKSFKSKRFGLETEMIAKALKEKVRIRQIDVRYSPRTYKQGKKINILDSIEMIKILLTLSGRYQVLIEISIVMTIIVSSFFLYTHTLNFFHTTDALPNTLASINFLQNKRLDFTSMEPLLKEKDLIGISISNNNGIIFPKTPPILSILSTPWIFLINKWYGVGVIDLAHVFDNNYVQYIGKITASIYSAFSLGIIYATLRRLKYTRDISIVATTIGILGTGYFNTISQANWSHAFSVFFISLYLVIVIGKAGILRYFICGLLMAILVHIRISNIFFLTILPIYAYMEKKLRVRTLTAYISGFLIAYVTYVVWQRNLGVPYGYSSEIMFSLREITPKLFILNFMSILFSYNYGLFYYSPILLLIFFSYLRKNNMTKALLSTLILLTIFASIWWMWTGGMSLNARLLSEGLPICIILLAASIASLWHLQGFRALVVVLTAISLYTNVLTTYMMDYSWHDTYLERGGHRSQVHNAWVHNPTLLSYLASRQYVTVVKLQKKEDGLYENVRVYRPSLVYRGLPKLYDNSQKIIAYE